jgi:Signal recognition particle GTPase
MGWLQRLSTGLTKTRDVVRGSLDRLLGRAADPALLEEFEAALIASDLGTRVVDRVMERLKNSFKGPMRRSPVECMRYCGTPCSMC